MPKPPIAPFKHGQQWEASRKQLNSLVDQHYSQRVLTGDSYIQVEGVGGIGHAITLNTRALTAVFQRGEVEFWARIDSSTALNAAPITKWSYTFTEVQKATLGYGGWATKANGHAGVAYNSIEDMNDGAGVQGNGVDVDNLDTAEFTFAIQPAPADVIVRMYRVLLTVLDNETPEHWFQYENGVDGECD